MLIAGPPSSAALVMHYVLAAPLAILLELEATRAAGFLLGPVIATLALATFQSYVFSHLF